MSLDEKKIISWNNKEIILWDKNTGNLLSKITYSKNNSIDIIFDKSKNKMLGWQTDTIFLWDISSNKVKALQNFTHSDVAIPSKYSIKTFIQGVELSKKEDKLLTWSLDIIRLWNIVTGEIILEIKSKGLNGVKFNRDNNKILSWDYSGKVKLWNTQNGKELISFRHNKSVLGVFFNKNETQILTWDFDHVVRIWDIEDGKELLNIKHNIEDTDFIKKAIFINNEKNILSWTNYGEIKLINLYENKELNFKYYSLEVEVKTGTYLSKSGEIKNLSKKDWLQKKQKYEQILKEVNQ